MKLTKDTLIEGEVYSKGKEVLIKEEYLPDNNGIDIYDEYLDLLKATSDLGNKTRDSGILRSLGVINKELERIEKYLDANQPRR